jgi:hypothetical protein
VGVGSVTDVSVVHSDAIRKPEYLNRSGRPLLDNGSVNRLPVSLSE